MKLEIQCATCFKEGVGAPSMTESVEFRDDGRYKLTCPKGHTSVTILQQQRFELLFDIGAYAILDGYYREAVSSFSAALERFCEFFIKVICISKDIDWETVSTAWKHVSSMSERQLGAYIFMYLSEFGSLPPLLPNKMVELRNKVVHKGKIPSREEAIQFGQEVLYVVRPTLAVLKEKYQPSKLELIRRSALEVKDLQGGDYDSLTVLVQTILSTATLNAAIDKMNLEEILELLPKHRG
jgi:polyhydroxyalkanoate synthesis regulator phasin